MQTLQKNLWHLVVIGGLAQGMQGSPGMAQELPPPARDPRSTQAQPAATPQPAAPRPATPQRRSAQDNLPAPARSTNTGKQRDAAGTTVPADQPLYFPPDEAPLQMDPKSAPTPVPTKAKPAGAAKPASRPAAKPGPKKLRPVSVGGVSISGLNDQQALAKLRRALSPKLRDHVALWDGTEKHLVTREALGATIPYRALLTQARQQPGGVNNAVKIPLRFNVDEKRAQSALQSIARKINREVEKASLDVDNGVAVLKGGDGVEVAVVGSAQRVVRALTAQPPQSYVELVVQRKVGGTASFNTLKQFRYLLASFSTPYDSGIRGRTNNLRMAAREVDGTIVEAGKIFSTNQAIGPRNAAAGWREAKMFVNGQVVSGTGAGICQCSTTIYNAALLAGLPIVERYPHSFRVNYAPASRDAAIAWGSKDFRFRNNTGGPIYVQTFLKGERFHVRLYGTNPAPRGIEVQSRVISSGNGTRSEAYRLTPTPNGVVKERLSRDYYKPHP